MAMLVKWDFRNYDAFSPQPVWLSEQGADMAINENIPQCVVFIGIRDERGAFAPYGTAFVVLWEHEERLFPYLVTAAHVLRDMRSSGCPWICRLNSKSEGVQFALLGEELWFYHPTIRGCDIAVSPFNASRDTFDYMGVGLSDGVLTDKYREEYDIGYGDEVFTIGLLTRHFGRDKNIPVVRVGNIAAVPDEKVDLGSYGEQEAYLIESRSIGGLSGSPVFLRTPPMRLVRTEVKNMGGHHTEYLMGVNIGLFETSAHADRARSEAEAVRESFLESVSAGIAIVVPIQRAIEIIQNTPELADHRQRVMEARRKRAGFTPSSAHEVSEEAAELEPATKADNPQHKEDFNRLLGEAVSGRKRGSGK